MSAALSHAPAPVSDEELRTQARQDLAIRSFADFVVQAWPQVEPGTTLEWNWHIGVICDVLEDAFHGVPPRHRPDYGVIRELVICIPPRHLKSRLVSVFFQAWAWLHRPGWRVINLANEQSLATRDSRDLRTVVQSGWYRGLLRRISALAGEDKGWEILDQQHGWFIDLLKESTTGDVAKGSEPWKLADDQNQKVNFANTHGGYRICLSVGANITGKGADCMLIDDPYDAKAALRGGVERTAKRMKLIVDDYDQVWKSRLNNQKTGLRITIMQRLHPDDLAGVLIKRGAYAVVLPTEYDPELPEEYGGPYPGDPRQEPGQLLNPQRFGRQQIREEKHTESGARNYSAQHGQRPVASEGGAWKREWMGQRYHWDPQRPEIDLKLATVLLSADTASKKQKTNDYWSVQIWAAIGVRRYLLDNLHARMRYTEGRQALWDMYTKWKHVLDACVIEDASSGMHLVDDLKPKIPALIGIKPTRFGPDKETKASFCAPIWEAGNVILPADAPWLADYVAELVSFPNVTHDDQVDATTQALLWFREHFAEADDPYEGLFRAFGL